MRLAWCLPLVVAVIIAGCVPVPPRAQLADVPAVQSVHTVFLGSFGDSELAKEVRERLRAELLRNGRFSPVDAETGADATITGSVGVSKSEVDGYSNFRAHGLLRMVQRGSGRVIWMHEYRDARKIAPIIEDDPSVQVRLLVGQFSQQLQKAANGG